MRNVGKAKKAKPSGFRRMRDFKSKARKERTQKAMRRRSEVAKARGVISGVVWTGAIFAVIMAIFAGNMIPIKNPQRFGYYETKTYTYYGETYTEQVYHEKDPNDFNWEIFFLAFFVCFVPVVTSSWAALAAVDCAAGVSRDDEGDRMLFEDDQKEKERRAKMEQSRKLTIEEELQKEEEKKATNALLDELTKDDGEEDKDEKA